MFEGVLNKKHENYSSRFPEGVQKRKSNDDDKHDHGQEKRRPSTPKKLNYLGCVALNSMKIELGSNTYLQIYLYIHVYKRFETSRFLLFSSIAKTGGGGGETIL